MHGIATCTLLNQVIHMHICSNIVVIAVDRSMYVLAHNNYSVESLLPIYISSMPVM